MLEPQDVRVSSTSDFTAIESIYNKNKIEAMGAYNIQGMLTWCITTSPRTGLPAWKQT